MDIRNSSKRKTLLATLVGLFAVSGGQVVAQGGEAATRQGAIDEIIVTANKRKQSLQDTSISISALTSNVINKRGLVSMADYLPSLPSVSMQDRGASQNSIVMRGIASDPQLEDPAAGVYFGETPVTGLGSAGGFAGSADLKLVDIERVEVLRGPQGTLYGDASMGGAVRIIPASPNLEQVEGKLSTSYSQTSDRGGNNNSVQGVFNLPLVEHELAIRGVAYRYDNSGYIKSDDASLIPNLAAAMAQGGVAENSDDLGKDEYTGFRLTTLWQPSDKLSVSLAHTDQDIEQNGIPEVNLEAPGKFQQLRLSGAQGQQEELLNSDVSITNLVVEYDMGWGNLLSSSSWLDYNSSQRLDLSHIFAFPYFGSNGSETETLIEELRFTSSFDGPFQVLAGIYYLDKDSSRSQSLLWSGDPAQEGNIAALLLDPATNLPFTSVENSTKFVETLEQKAFFSELTYEITEKLIATVGARYFDYDTESKENSAGWLSRGIVVDSFGTSNSGSNYKVDLSFRPNENSLVYGQWAEGFRLGGAQPGAPSACTDPNGLIAGVTVDGKAIANGSPVEPDELESFELGIKSTLLDNRLNISAAAYRINWEGMPVGVIPPCFLTLVTVNAGASISEGVELEAQARITDKLTVSLGASYNDSTLKEDVPVTGFVSGFGSKGDNLPGSADYNISLGVEYLFTLLGKNAFVRSDFLHVSKFHNNFDETGEAAGGYDLLNLKAGITLDQFDVDVFVNNLTNADDFTWVESLYGALGSQRAYRLRPRTLGLNIAYRF